MKKNLFLTAIVAIIAMFTSSYAYAENILMPEPSNNQITVMTGANGEIMNVEGTQGYARTWQIRDLSGPTNIRNKPNGKVCMKLKAWTQYTITTNGQSGQWLNIISIYNCREGYWVRLHSSSTGTYWIASSILYEI